MLVHGDFTFDATFSAARHKCGTEVTFTRAEAAVIGCLVRNVGRVLSRGQILDRISEVGSDKNDRNVDFVVNRIRRKLGDTPRRPRYIATRYGEGYAWLDARPDRRSPADGGEIVIGPVRGLRHLETLEPAARSFADHFYRRFAQEYGADRRVVFDPECPPAQDFPGDPPDIGIALSFYRDGTLLDCVVHATAFRSGQTYSLSRHDLATDADGHEVFAAADRLVTRLAADIWKSLTLTASATSPLPVAMHDASQALRGGMPGWAEGHKRLEDLVAADPTNHAIRIMLASNIHSKYVQHGLELFASGQDTCAEDEARIESLVTANLPYVGQDPFLSATAAQLLFFVGHGYRDMAVEMIERIARETAAVPPSLVLLGTLRFLSGRIEEGLAVLDQAQDMAPPGSELEVYILCLKCQALMAIRDRTRLDRVLARLYALRPPIQFVYDIFYGVEGQPTPQAAAAMQTMTVAQARGMIVFADYLCGRLFADPVHRRNTLAPPLALLGQHFGSALLDQIDPDAPSGR